MSAASGLADAVGTPQLSFQLPGRWLALDPRSPYAEGEIERVVREVVGVADDAALARRRLRESLGRAADAARRADAHGFFACLEIAPEIRVPASVTVHAPTGMRMTPAVGTSADAVLATLRASFAELSVDGIDTATRLDGPRASMLRLERLSEEVVEEGGETATVTRLEVEYWFAVPGSKQVVLALFVSPLGELRNALRNLFDSIALAAWFGPEA
ncbi:hypothetical protein ACIQLJ_02240 [Microbacterium sp. NPDC091313]